MNSIVTVERGELMTDTQIIAKALDTKHAYVMRVVEQFLEDFPDLRGATDNPKNRAQIIFEYRNYRGHDYKVALLNSTAAFLLLTRIDSAKKSHRMLDLVTALSKSSELSKILLDALENFEVPDDLPSDLFVYAIQNTETGSVKLGISRNPEQRLKQLQTGNDCKLELIQFRRAKNGFADEVAMHFANKQRHIRGEWFSSEALGGLQ
jgi:hypothetical protein